MLDARKIVPTVAVCWRSDRANREVKSCLLHVYYAPELDNLHDDKEIDQLELDWITWQRDYVQNKARGDSRSNACKM